MDFMLDNWFIIFGIIAAVVVLVLIIYDWLKLPTEEQIETVKQWLIWAVNEAEEELGSGTGQRKLRLVYDMFLTRFPYLSRVVTFNAFSTMVDEALDKVEMMLTAKPEEKGE